MMVMFNPSHAGPGGKWDKTTQTIIEYVERGTFGERINGVKIRNIFTYQSPKPDELVEDLIEIVIDQDEDAAYDAVGAFNYESDDTDFLVVGQGAAMIVAAWGNCGENTSARSFVIRKKADVARWFNANFRPGKVHFLGAPTTRKNPPHPLRWPQTDGVLRQEDIPFNPRHD